MTKFQSTHPHGVRLDASINETANSISFNPRTRTGCDYKGSNLLHDSAVSIHAPARGATNAAVCTEGVRVFQSTHPHGVRPYTQQ